MISFALVCEFGRVTAALIPRHTGINSAQLRSIYALLPEKATSHTELAERWNQCLVICESDWARVQLRRVPMLPPKNQIKLAFL